jgi:hypothetical protein
MSRWCRMARCLAPDSMLGILTRLRIISALQSNQFAYAEVDMCTLQKPVRFLFEHFKMAKSKNGMQCFLLSD